MDFEDEKIKEIVKKTLESNFVKMDSTDYIYFKKLSNNLSLKPIKNKKAVGAIIYFKLNKKHTSADVTKKAEAIVTRLPEDADAIWAANKGNSKRLTATIIYMY